MRKLVTLREIDKITPIDGADKLECLHIGGWTVVDQKGKFYQGQRVLFFEEDSLIPLDRGYFSHLARFGVTQFAGKDYFRVKAIRLRGQISQGLVFPHVIVEANPDAQWDQELDCPKNIDSQNNKCSPYLDPDWVVEQEIEIYEKHEGNYADYFGVVKYEPQVENGQKEMPSFISITDQERVQNLSDLLPLIQEDNGFYVATEKIDGTSCSIYSEISDNTLRQGVCSHHFELEKNTQDCYWDIASTPLIDYLGEKLSPLDYLKARCFEQKIHKLSKYDDREPRYVLQGEIFGEKIQNNPLKVKGRHILFFDLWENDQRLSLIEIEERFPELIRHWVPFHPQKLATTMDEIVKQPNGVTTLVPYADRDAQIEGFVWRHTRKPEIQVEEKGHIKTYRNSFKVISGDYLVEVS